MLPENTPIVTFAVAENELRMPAAAAMIGNYAAWNYFQSIDRPENLAFVRGFKARYGSDRTTSDVIVASSNSVHLWAQAVREAETVDVRPVRNAIRHQSLAAPEGIIAIDPETQHTWRPVFIGRVRSDGQFDIVWSSRTAVRPVPFPISRSRAASATAATADRPRSAPVGRAGRGRFDSPGDRRVIFLLVPDPSGTPRMRNFPMSGAFTAIPCTISQRKRNRNPHVLAPARLLRPRDTPDRVGRRFAGCTSRTEHC
jgi:hypothetical protein